MHVNVLGLVFSEIVQQKAPKGDQLFRIFESLVQHNHCKVCITAGTWVCERGAVGMSQSGCRSRSQNGLQTFESMKQPHSCLSTTVWCNWDVSTVMHQSIHRKTDGCRMGFRETCVRDAVIVNTHGWAQIRLCHHTLKR